MKKTLSAFTLYLKEIDHYIKKAGKQPNPAFALSLGNARTSAFRLEGLARLFAKLHDKKVFGQLNKQVKELEDALGAIDHYSVLEKTFLPDAAIPIHIKEYFTLKTQEKTEELNVILKKKKWLSGKRVKAFRKNLKQVKWLKTKSEIAAIASFYETEIADIKSFIDQCTFTDMENDVHELRRKIRWLSIYAMALQGKVSLVSTTRKSAGLKKYLTPNIVNSPFNKIEGAADLKQHVELEKNYFLALSWLIATIGDIKDEGLTLTALQEAYIHTEQLDEKSALKKAQSVSSQPSLSTLLAKSAEITRLFMKEGNFDKLLATKNE